MIFQAPHFLFGLIALAIPIIIHLFNFRKARKIYFSSTTFIKKVNEVSSAKRKLKHYLVLFSRILAVLFLVLAFAQPFIPAGEETLAQKVIIYFDNSNSMSNESGIETSAFDEGLKFVEKILDIYPRETQYKLITNDFDPFSNIFRTGDEIREQITEMSYSNLSRTNEELIYRVNSEIVGETDVYWVSDFQKSVNKSLSVPDSAMNLRLFPLTYTSDKNIFVDTVYIEDPFGISPRFTFELKNAGSVSVNNINVKIFLNDVQVYTQSVDIPNMGSREINYDYDARMEERIYGRVELEDFPVTFDNEFYFTVEPPSLINILAISNIAESPILDKVYGNDKLFNINSVSSTSLNYNSISEQDVIIINRLKSIPSSLSLSLAEFYKKGGTIVIIPAPEMELDTYDFLPPNIFLKNSIGGEAQISMATPDYQNPFFSNVFEELNISIEMPEARSVMSWFNDRDAILRLKNGTPFLSNYKAEGDIYLFASPFESEFTNFHYHALFVPVMYKIAMLSKDFNEGLYNNLNNPVFTFKIENSAKENIIRLQKESFELIPEQTAIGNSVTFELPGSQASQGFYEVIIEEKVIGAIALNNDKRESKMEQYVGPGISSLFYGNNIEVLMDVRPEDTEEYFKDRFEGKSLWRHCLVLTLLFLLCEIILLKYLK